MGSKQINLADLFCGAVSLQPQLSWRAGAAVDQSVSHLVDDDVEPEEVAA